MRITREVLNLLQDNLDEIEILYEELEKIDIDTKVDSYIFHEDFRKNKKAYIELQDIIDQLEDFKKDKSLVYEESLNKLTADNLIKATKLQADYLCRLINLTSLITSTEVQALYQAGYFKTLPILASIVEERLGLEPKPNTNFTTTRVCQLLSETKPLPAHISQPFLGVTTLKAHSNKFVLPQNSIFMTPILPEQSVTPSQNQDNLGSGFKSAINKNR